LVADEQQNDDSKPLPDIELERLKMYQDTFKHISTFSSGAILLTSAVTGALFLPKLVNGMLLALSIVLLSVGTFGSLMGLALVPRRIDSAIDGSTRPPWRLTVLLWVSVLSALFGMVLFSYFAVYNLLPQPFASSNLW
jgi:hypothetical protein